MQHLDPDRLVLLALSEETADTDESVHLAECPGCARRAAELKGITLRLREPGPMVRMVLEVANLD
ncbi:hypothetical protein AB0C29_46530, partial [Actinoplanes sp. NPDC048791]